MQKTINSFLWVLLVLLAVGVAGYAFSYLNFNPSFGFLNAKPDNLKASLAWKMAFYLHASFGGVALIAGAFQFSQKLRKNLQFHRMLGKLYLAGITVSGVAGFGLSLFAEGGIIARTGFNLLAIVWLATSWKAYSSIRQKDVDTHKTWMIRSYAACCAAITLRIILPLEMGLLQMDFTTAYQIVAWMCWVPNMIAAELFIRRAGKMALA